MEKKEFETLTDAEKIRLLEANNRVLIIQNRLAQIERSELSMATMQLNQVMLSILNAHRKDTRYDIDSNYNIIRRKKNGVG